MNYSAQAYESVRAQGENDLVVRHASLVKRIALHLAARLPDSVQLDDLIQAGMIGLLEASRSFDSSHGASFQTYAGIRIRGAMLDEIRRLDWAPRSVHRKSRDVARVVREIEQAEGREARDAEVVEVLGITLNDYHQILNNASNAQIFSLDHRDDESSSWEPAADQPEPGGMLEAEGFQDALAGAIRELPEREQLVMSLYYEQELNLREIGEVLGVTESRVSQIHGRIALKLKASLADWMN